MVETVIVAATVAACWVAWAVHAHRRYLREAPDGTTFAEWLRGKREGCNG